MSGHSKWASIKHKKGAADAKKGKVFTKLAANIYSAARQGGGDADKNFRLRLVIDQAKAANMPSTNIDRAIKKGTGELGGAAVEEILYEGYGPSGTAILVEAATDNRNRTATDIRTAFTKNGGTLGETGSVAYLFDRKGQVQLALLRNATDGQAVGSQQLAGEDLELAIIDSGAEDFEENDGEMLVYTKPNELMSVATSLRDAGVVLGSTELTYIPKSEVQVFDKEKAGKIIRLMEALEALDDVLNVSSNFNIDEKILNELE